METINISALVDNEIDRLVTSICHKYDGLNPELINELWIYNRELPIELWTALNRFKYSEKDFGVLLIKGHHLQDSEIGLTPDSPILNSVRTLRQDVLLLLLGSVLGDAISWSTQRNGMIINDIIPIRGNEYEQLSLGSKACLEWHTEEAFHPYRPDYLGLYCLRNPALTSTTLASISDIKLSDKTKSILFEPRFIFDVDNNFQAWKQRANHGSCVLFGDFNQPYVKLDPAFMKVLPHDKEARSALNEIIYEFNSNLQDLVLSPGDICFIDNFRAVHGRSPFVPKYDGKDRWLKRVNITRDLRKSREARKSSESRIIIVD